MLRYIHVPFVPLDQLSLNDSVPIYKAWILQLVREIHLLAFTSTMGPDSSLVVMVCLSVLTTSGWSILVGSDEDNLHGGESSMVWAISW